MFIISKEFAFEAAHQLINLAEGHPCTVLHGHSYRVRVELACEDNDLKPPGFVQDYKELDDIKTYINETLDHHFLNDLFPFETTAENMAKFLYDKFKPIHPLITAVHLSETKKTWATYRKTFTRTPVD